MGKRRWRYYETNTGQPVKEFLGTWSEEDVAAVAVAMKEVREKGLRSVRHLQGEIYEVRTSETGSSTGSCLRRRAGEDKCLALVVFSKKTQKTPPRLVRLAQQRLRDWKRRGIGAGEGPDRQHSVIS